MKNSPSWLIPSGERLVPIEDAGAVLLLSAASGLAGALVHANSVSLAVGIATAYLRMRTDEGACPICALSRVSTPVRSFEGVCLTETITADIDDRPHHIRTSLVRRVKVVRGRWWERRPHATIELVDGSEYRNVLLRNRHLEFLTLIGRQSVRLLRRDVTVRGHTVAALDELRTRITSILQREEQHVVKTVGQETFAKFFRPAA